LPTSSKHLTSPAHVFFPACYFHCSRLARVILSEPISPVLCPYPSLTSSARSRTGRFPPRGGIQPWTRVGQYFVGFDRQAVVRPRKRERAGAAFSIRAKAASTRPV
jgi:hypothetical protein